MLTIYRRHVRPCQHTTRRFKKCQCPIWVQGSLRGEYIRRSLDLRSWQAASDLVHEWEASGKIGEEKPRAPIVEVAVAKFLEHAASRGWRAESIKKYRRLLEGEFIAYCKERNVAALDRVTFSFLEDFRAAKLKQHAPITHAKKLEYLRGFMRFCERAGWISKNPAKDVELPTVRQAPTLPFSDEEFARLLLSVRGFKGNVPRMRALLLLLRHSGLRIGDAVALERSRLKNGKLFLYTQKTGTPVHIPLPPEVVKALDGLPGDRYFWSGKGLKSGIESYRRRLVSIAERAKVENAHFHRFRDSFAVGLLEKGVSLETVSILLGHASLKVTEKHYRPWVHTLQQNLEIAVRATWKTAKTGTA